MPALRAGMIQKLLRKMSLEALIYGRKCGWLLIAVIAIDSLLAAGVWFAVGYIVQ
jgi:hypothetical protein